MMPWTRESVAAPFHEFERRVSKDAADAPHNPNDRAPRQNRARVAQKKSSGKATTRLLTPTTVAFRPRSRVGREDAERRRRSRSTRAGNVECGWFPGNPRIGPTSRGLDEGKQLARFPQYNGRNEEQKRPDAAEFRGCSPVQLFEHR
jgi:hypothetical protein